MTLTDNDIQSIAALVQPVYDRLDKMDSEILALQAGQLDMQKELRDVKRKVFAAYDLALEAWGTGFENRKWLESGSVSC